MNFKKLLLLVILLLLLPSVIAQAQHVISNSADWKDVYSTTLYANLQKIPNNFLTSTRHSTLILYSIPKTKENVQVITGRDSPYIVGYEDILKANGYDNAEELIFDEVNLELAKLLPNIHRYIIVDPNYGYNALSAAPYAAQAGYYVIFVDEINIGDVVDFFDDQGVDNLIVLGQVDREVREELEQYNPEIVNKGDRFDNNVAMVEKYLNVRGTKQTILTNGEFIEAGLMSGADPVLFIGRTNVPDKVREFILDSDIDVGILIGNELISAATFIRRQLGISVFVKFAQGSRAPGGPISQVEDLDRFAMPRFELDMSIESIVYNRATGQLEVAFSNNAGISSYFKSTITINIDGNPAPIVIGDDDAIFVDGNDLITVTYDVDIPEGNANASVFTIFGEAPNSLENTLEGTLEIDFVEVNDESAIQIVDLVYDTRSGKFHITIKNTGDVKSYIDAELLNLVVNEEKVTVGGDEILELEPGKSGTILASIELDDQDILDNEIIRVRGRFGQRKLALIKVTEAEFEFKEKGVDLVYYLLIVVIGILLFMIWRRKNCPKCGKKSVKKAKDGHRYCSKCHWKNN